MSDSQANGWNRALVTGASSGIGKEIAKLLAKQGTDLVLVARDQDRLVALADELPVHVEVLPADLGDREQLSQVVQRLQATTAPIDLLVNNAGFGFSGDFVDLDPLEESAVIDVNVSAMHRLAHAAAATMASRGRGGILNVSSVAGFAPSPKTATYAASKAFVTSLSEALHVELGPMGVVVTCLCPGLTRTEFQDRAGMDVSSIPNALWQPAETVAIAGLRGLAKGKAIVIPGAQNKAFRGVLKASPASLVRQMSKAVSAVR